MFQKSERGSIALLLTVIVLSVIFVISMGMAMVRIIEIQIASDVVGSSKAYQAADSGLECILNELNEDRSGATIMVNCPNGTMVGDGFYNSEIIAYDASGDVEKLISIGVSGNVKRAFEVTLP